MWEQHGRLISLQIALCVRKKRWEVNGVKSKVDMYEYGKKGREEKRMRRYCEALNDDLIRSLAKMKELL